MLKFMNMSAIDIIKFFESKYSRTYGTNLDGASKHYQKIYESALKIRDICDGTEAEKERRNSIRY